MLMLFTPNHFWVLKILLCMTQRCESTVFSTIWISVQIINNGNASMSKTFVSFCKLKENFL